MSGPAGPFPIPAGGAPIEGVYVYCAVLDVLGYRTRLEQDRTSGRADFKASLQQALSVLSEINDAQCRHEAISDTIFLTWPNQPTFVDFLQLNKRLFVSFLKHGLFLRGGITYSRHFRSGNVTYSFAIATAYELESKSAVHPRIVIDKNIVLMFENPGAALDYAGLVGSSLIVEANGTYFLNVIDQTNWTELYEAARNLFVHDAAQIAENEQAFAKHVWFENYLFHTAGRHRKKRYIPPPTPLRQSSETQR
jgi:hypothetical protein